ncbi:MAG: hypothetical protein ACJAXH_001769 [Colwellia sp.]|jgi:hypothetical protein
MDLEGFILELGFLAIMLAASRSIGVEKLTANHALKSTDSSIIDLII